MSLRHVSPGHRLAGAGLLATLVAAAVGWSTSQTYAARPHPAHDPHDAHQGAAKDAPKHGRHGPLPRVVHGPDYHPPYAAIVVDDNTGQVLHEVNADEPRHPASVTKIMTLYMLFDLIEAGKFKLDTPLTVSSHAASQPPVKLGLKANQTITVEDAIKGMVTKSANDAAATVGEAIGGGDEAEAARLMTQKARELGMSNTTYINTSGLPADDQFTTARDQALLGRIIQNRFPNFYRYFSTPSFNYHGREHHNHNGLLGNVRGVDGIKTGYTEASGYNLVASVHRDDRHIIAVVMGGTSNGMRDARMRQLIEEYTPQASTHRTVPPILEAAHPENPSTAPAVAVTAPVPAAVVVPAENVAKPNPPAPTPVVTAVAPGRNVETANPIAPTSAAPVPGGDGETGITTIKAEPARLQSPQKEAAKPRFRGSKPPAAVARQPQAQAPKAVATAAPAVRPAPHPAASKPPTYTVAGSSQQHQAAHKTTTTAR